MKSLMKAKVHEKYCNSVTKCCRAAVSVLPPDLGGPCRGCGGLQVRLPEEGGERHHQLLHEASRLSRGELTRAD